MLCYVTFSAVYVEEKDDDEEDEESDEGEDDTDEPKEACVFWNYIFTVIILLVLNLNLVFCTAPRLLLLCHLLTCNMLSVYAVVCLSVTWVDQSKTVEVRIMQFPPYSSSIPL